MTNYPRFVFVSLVSLLFLTGARSAFAAAPTIEMSANPASVDSYVSDASVPPRGESTVTWSSTGATSCVWAWRGYDYNSVDRPSESLYGRTFPPQGTLKISFGGYYGDSELANRLNSKTRPTLICSGVDGNTEKSIDILLNKILPSGPAPIINISASPQRAQAFIDRTKQGGDFNDAVTKLTWSVTGAKSCEARRYIIDPDGTRTTFPVLNSEWLTASLPLSGSKELHMVKEYPDFTYYWGGTGETKIAFGLECISEGRVKSSKNVEITLLQYHSPEAETTISAPKEGATLTIGNNQTFTWSTKNVDPGTTDSRSPNRIMIQGVSDGDPWMRHHSYTIAKDIPTSGSFTWKVGEIVPGSYVAAGESGAKGGMDVGAGSDAASVPPGTYSAYFTIMGTNVDGQVVSYGAVKNITIRAGGGSSTPTPGGTNTTTGPTPCSGSAILCATTSSNTSSSNTSVAGAAVTSAEGDTKLTASTDNLLLGKSLTLSWQSKDAQSCTAYGSWGGAKAFSGQEVITPKSAGKLSYGLICVNNKAKLSRTIVNVTVKSDAAPTLTTPNTSGATITKTLKLGSRDYAGSKQVYALQSILNKLGFLDAKPTGYFGAMTAKAVKLYQGANGIDTTGTVGPITRAAITGTVPASTPTTPASTPAYVPSGKVFACGTIYTLSEAQDANIGIAKLVEAAKQKDVSNPLPKTSSGVQPVRHVEAQQYGQYGQFIVRCVVGGFGGSPIWTSYAQRVGLADEAMRFAPVAGETFGQRFDRMSKRFCNLKNGAFPEEYDFAICARLYQELAGASAGMFGTLPAGDILPLGSLLSSETPSTQVNAKSLYQRLIQSVSLPVPTRDAIEKDQYKYLVSQQQWKLLLDRQVKKYETNYQGATCEQPAAQMKADHESDLVQYPIGGHAKADPDYQVGYGYAHLMVDFSRLNICTLAYLGAKEINRLNPFLTNHDVPSVMLPNASLYNDHEKALLYASAPGGYQYADSFYWSSGYDWDNTISKKEGLYRELVAQGKGGLINYCSSNVPYIGGKSAFEKALEGWMSANTMKQTHGSQTGCEAFAYDCRMYEGVQCQQNYPSKYCGENFAATWDKYCK